ncbi:uncharacterized protein VTP21DRAFT_4025 [Calcarisporiella thermophila]|uniref:uncharacterized protein n=1 Tax=Calcarisporiella thermophila TaxID=911321 RepID=UPI003743F3ED
METSWATVGKRSSKSANSNAYVKPPTVSGSKLIQLQRSSTGGGLSGSVGGGGGVGGAGGAGSVPVTGFSLLAASGLTQQGAGSGTSKYTVLKKSLGGGEEKINGSSATTTGPSSLLNSAGNINAPPRSINTLVPTAPTPTPSNIHPLKYTWIFYFMHRSPGAKVANYEGAMKRIAAFSSIEDFWAVYSHLKRPHELPSVSDYHLFKQGVRPVWEDDANINGGKWIVRLKKGLASRLWENLLLAVIGEQFDVGDEICGLVISIRSSEDILSLWNRSANEGRINLKIRDTLKRVLGLPMDTVMEYKAHTDALRDNSSFRNTDVFR